MNLTNNEKWVQWVKVGCTHFFIEFIGKTCEFHEWVVVSRERYTPSAQKDIKRENPRIPQKWVQWAKVGATHFFSEFIGKSSEIHEWVVVFQERYTPRAKRGAP